MAPGDIVVVLGIVSERIRNKQEGLTIGTLEQILCDSQVSVLLPSGELWIGPSNLVKPAEEQV